MARLKTKYQQDVVPAMMKEFNYKNSMQVPRLEKITVNVGVGEATQNAKAIDSDGGRDYRHRRPEAGGDQSKKAIANFKLREGVPIGCMVTLRRDRMYEFLDRLIHGGAAAGARFQGQCRIVPSTAGATILWVYGSKLFFPEIHADKVEKTRGMTITITTTAKTDQEGRVLLKLMGMPFAELAEREKTIGQDLSCESKLRGRISSKCGNIIVVRCAAGRGRFTGAFACAGFAYAITRAKGISRD